MFKCVLSVLGLDSLSGRIWKYSVVLSVPGIESLSGIISVDLYLRIGNNDRLDKVEVLTIIARLNGVLIGIR